MTGAALSHTGCAFCGRPARLVSRGADPTALCGLDDCWSVANRQERHREVRLLVGRARQLDQAGVDFRLSPKMRRGFRRLAAIARSEIARLRAARRGK